MQEQEILELIKSHDERGMEALLAHYSSLMRYIIAPILQSPEDREECLSETALLIWNKIDLYDPQRGMWKTWITALTRNTALNFARNGRINTDELSSELPSSEPTPEEAALQKERCEALNHALNQLDLQEKILFYRKYYYLQSIAQIASELGLTERAVEGRLYRLKKELRKLLGGDGYGRT